MDSDHATWDAYDNQYWPAKYLIDKNGNIVYTHFGEGAYETTEAKIQELLKDLNNASAEKPISKPAQVETVNGSIGTQELYFGYNFKRALLGNEPDNMKSEGSYVFTIPEQISPNRPYLEGEWKNNADNFELVSNTGSILLFYKAKNVNIVASSKSGSQIIVNIGGKKHKELTVNNAELYRVVEGNDYEARLVELNITGSGFKINTFTFG